MCVTTRPILRPFTQCVEPSSFWTTVLDMDFHDQADGACALAVVDATPTILHENNDVARAQFTDWDNFQGWIAFDPHIT